MVALTFISAPLVASGIFIIKFHMMRRNLMNIFCFLLPAFAAAQTAHPFNTARARAFTGSPSGSTSLDVVALGQPTIQFSSGNEYDNGKTYPGYYRVVVAADGPWMLSVRAVSPFFTPSSQGAAATIPASIVSLKASTSADYIPLSVAQQNLILGDASSQGTSFFIDMKVNPSWSYSGGRYNQQIVFTLSPQ